jgi:hypothetical protein
MAAIDLYQDQIDAAEAALRGLGLDDADFNTAESHLDTRSNAQGEIDRLRTHQFYSRAFQLISQMNAQAASSDKKIACSEYLRAFAVFVAEHTLTLQHEHSTPEEIVDHLPEDLGTQALLQ